MKTESKSKLIINEDCNKIFHDFTDGFKIKKLFYNKENGFLKFETENVPSQFNDLLRHTIVEDVASIAIEKVFIRRNSGQVDDSDLEMAIMFLPINTNPHILKTVGDKRVLVLREDIALLDPNYVLVFDLNIKFKKGECRPKLYDTNGNGTEISKPQPWKTCWYVRSNDLVWRPIGDQESSGKWNKDHVQITQDVLLSVIHTNSGPAIKAKLTRLESSFLPPSLPSSSKSKEDSIFSSNQIATTMPTAFDSSICEISLRSLAVKGFGRNNAKFNPCSIVVPEPQFNIEFLEEVTGDDAFKLASLFPTGVIKVVDYRAVIGDTSLIKRTSCNNYQRFQNLRYKIQITMNQSKVMWMIESVRPLHQQPMHIVLEALSIIRNRAVEYNRNLVKVLKTDNDNSVIESFGKKVAGKTVRLDWIRKTGSLNVFIFKLYSESKEFGLLVVYFIEEKFKDKVLATWEEGDNRGYELHIELLIDGISGHEVFSEALNLIQWHAGFFRQEFLRSVTKAGFML